MLKKKPLEQYLLPRPRLASQYWLLPLMLAVVTVIVGVSALRESARLSAAASAFSSLQAAQNVAPKPKPKRGELEEQRRWNDLRAELSFSWPQVFDAVERTDRANIELLEFRPDKRNRAIILRGEARDQEALTAYLQALQEVPVLTRVHLVHRQTQAHDKFATVAFEIKATLFH